MVGTYTILIAARKALNFVKRVTCLIKKISPLLRPIYRFWLPPKTGDECGCIPKIELTRVRNDSSPEAFPGQHLQEEEPGRAEGQFAEALACQLQKRPPVPQGPQSFYC